MEKLQDRPPYVTFETRSEEDRESTIKAGHYVGRDVDYAIITPAGSKDRIERVVSDWFAQLPADVAAERLPAAWFDAYRKAYEHFKQGKELPPNGYPTVNWPGVAPSLMKTLLSLNLRAVEDIAAANEETLARIGMGARALKQRAIDFLAAAKDVGKVAENASATRALNDDLKTRNEQLTAQVEQLAAQVAFLTKAAGGVSGAKEASTTITSEDLLGDKL